MNELIEAGFTIRVKHRRYAKVEGARLMPESMITRQLRRSVASADMTYLEDKEILCCGGSTGVLISLPDKPRTLYSGDTNCSHGDRFDRRYGLYLALGRALEEAGLKQGDEFYDRPIPVPVVKSGAWVRAPKPALEAAALTLDGAAVE
jgi:hypothetical protein